MGNILSELDVQALLNATSVESKVELTKKISANYSNKAFTAEEKKLAEEIFRLIIRDSEIKIRHTLSEALKENEALPRDIAVSLAADVDEVAAPMLEYSPILTENDLLEILNNESMQKFLAVSRRKKLTDKLISRLAQSSIPEVIENMAKNSSQENGAKDFDKIISDIAHDREEIKKLISLVSIPPKMVETMMRNVASDMIVEAKKRYDFSPSTLDRVAGHTIELSTLSIIDDNNSQLEIDNLVAHLHDFNRLTTSMIISSLCTCKLKFFVSALARRAKIPNENIEILIERGGEEGIRKLMIKAEMPEKLHGALHVVLKFVLEKKLKFDHLSPRDFCKELITKLEYYNDRSKIEYLNYLLAIAKQSLKTQGFSSF